MSAWAERSDQIDLVAKALVACQTSLTDIVKGRKADTGKYSYTYADLKDALALVRPVFASQGLVITQTASSDDHDVVIHTTILHESGQYLTTMPIRFPTGQTIQQSGSAITYARRYALMAVCGLATEDDDGASAGTRDARPQREDRPPTEPKAIAPRTGEEREIRAILADLPASEAKAIRDEFRTQFGTTLSSLPVDDHPKALTWVTARALNIPTSENSR